MKHYGDITKINGSEVPVVDIVTGGFWCWLADRIVKTLKEQGTEEPTMASLFDGIGGFPLAFSAYGCRPVWASEIEEFPIAVTKYHFPEKEEESHG